MKSDSPLLSLGTRLLARDLKATKRPLALMTGSLLGPVALDTLRAHADSDRCRRSARFVTNMSGTSFWSSVTRLFASERNATICPSALMLGLMLRPSGSVESAAIEIRLVRPSTLSKM